MKQKQIVKERDIEILCWLEAAGGVTDYSRDAIGNKINLDSDQRRVQVARAEGRLVAAGLVVRAHEILTITLLGQRIASILKKHTSITNFDVRRHPNTRRQGTVLVLFGEVSGKSRDDSPLDFQAEVSATGGAAWAWKVIK